MDYNKVIVEIRQTEVYARWFRRLRDREARVRIDSRIRRLSLGNPGDVRPVGEGDFRDSHRLRTRFTECTLCSGERLWSSFWPEARAGTYEGRWSWPEDFSRLLKNGVCRGAEPLCRESEGVPQIYFFLFPGKGRSLKKVRKSFPAAC